MTIIGYSCPRNLLKTSHYISEAYAWFGASYFMYDIWSMYQVYFHATQASSNPSQQQNGDIKKKKQETGKFLYYVRTNPVIVGHHLFIGLFGFSVIVVRDAKRISRSARNFNPILLVVFTRRIRRLRLRICLSHGSKYAVRIPTRNLS